MAISLNKNTLIDKGSTQESRQECRAHRAVTLEEMKIFLALVVRELTHYRLFDVSDGVLVFRLGG